MVAHAGGWLIRWWRGLVLVGSCATDRPGLRTGFFGRNPCRLGRHRRGAACERHPPFLKGVVATLVPPPHVPGETLGPIGPGSSDRFLLEGAAWYSTVRRWKRGGTFSEGAAVTGHRSLVDPPMSPFVFFFLFLRVLCAVAPAGVVLRLYPRMYGGCCFIYKAGRKHIS